jgi:hypothetical protein
MMKIVYIRAFKNCISADCFWTSFVCMFFLRLQEFLRFLTNSRFMLLELISLKIF